MSGGPNSILKIFTYISSRIVELLLTTHPQFVCCTSLLGSSHLKFSDNG